jgi:hypothetical protein
MTDARLRAVSRAAARGDPTAHIALLLERVRAGELSTERLQLAAWLGDDHARAVVGPDLVRPQPDELLPWLLCLTEIGSREAVVRALAAVGTSQIAKHPTSPAVAKAVSLIRRWIEQPVGDTTLAAAAARLSSRAARRSRRGASPTLLCAWAAQLAGSPADRWFRLARRRLTRWSEIASEDPRPRIRLALLPWALGSRPRDQRRRSVVGGARRTCSGPRRPADDVAG